MRGGIGFDANYTVEKNDLEKIPSENQQVSFENSINILKAPAWNISCF